MQVECHWYLCRENFLPDGSLNKASANNDFMRADMGESAVCLAIVTAAKLNLPLNIIDLPFFVKISPDISQQVKRYHWSQG